jgi:hypothetical protein
VRDLIQGQEGFYAPLREPFNNAFLVMYPGEDRKPLSLIEQTRLDRASFACESYHCWFHCVLIPDDLA